MSTRDIPVWARVAVKARAGAKCERCGMGVAAGHWHHRRSRSVRDDLTHDPRNGVYLCPACHDWVHGHPFESRSEGWIVSRHSDPTAEPIKHWSLGVVMLAEEGRYGIRSFTGETE